jgi:hypothetical protein
VTASVRLRTFNFVKMLCKCHFTVVALMKRFAPISLLLLPCARVRRILKNSYPAHVPSLLGDSSGVVRR